MIIGVVVVIISAAGYFALTRKPAEAPIPAGFQEETVKDWEIYRDEKYEFEINYPKNWEAAIKKYAWEKNYVQFKPLDKKLPEEILINIYAVNLKDPNESFIPELDETGHPLGGGMKGGALLPEVNIGGRKFYKDSSAFEGQKDITYLTFNKSGDKIANITFIVRGGRQRMDYYIPESEYQSELNTFNQILSTFKFVE